MRADVKFKNNFKKDKARLYWSDESLMELSKRCKDSKDFQKALKQKKHIPWDRIKKATFQGLKDIFIAVLPENMKLGECLMTLKSDVDLELDASKKFNCYSFQLIDLKNTDPIDVPTTVNVTLADDEEDDLLPDTDGGSN